MSSFSQGRLIGLGPNSSSEALDNSTNVGSLQTWGIGDEGKRNAFAAVSDTCEIAGLKYKNCVMRATEGKRSADGLIGPDLFSDFLIHIDFRRRQLHLTPFLPRDPNPQGYDRVISAEEKDFTPVFRAFWLTLDPASRT